MIKYNLTEFPDDQDGECPMETVNTGRTHVRFHSGRSIWESRSTLEKVLALFCLILAAICILLLFLMSRLDSDVIFPYDHNLDHLHHKDVCVSAACVDVAASILASADFSVDPCEDFYQYACGGWVKSNPIPYGKSMWGTFGKLWQQNQLVIKNVLEAPPEDLANDAERKAQLFYRSCVDADGITESRGAAPLLELIRKVGGWNITSGNFSAATWDFQKMLQQLQNEYNVSPLFSWSVVEDDKNSSSYVIQVDQGGLTLPSRDYYLNKTTATDPVLKAYLEYMTRVGVLLGGTERDVRLQADDVITLETQLANMTTPPELRRDEEAIYHNMSVTDLQSLAPFLDWLAFFQNAFQAVNITLPTDLRVVVYAPDYLSKLSRILNRYLATLRGKVILNNFMMSKLAGSLVRYLSKDFREADNALNKALVGTDAEEEAWQLCVDETNGVLGFALGAMFVRKNFQLASKKLAEEMIADIRASFISNAHRLTWMDSETRALAEEKAEAITKMIGFPPSILDADYLNDKYAALAVNESQYFENKLRNKKYTLLRGLQKYGKPVNKTRWDMTPPSVNAYYSASHNMIVFPAGILQAPFYDAQYPRSLNFGAMGVVMGHELTHAFDDQGREYDKNGNMNQWWKNETIARFKNRTQCMVDQYSQFKLGNLTVNGRQTLGENIADNGGLKAAFDAFQLYRRHHGEELPLPGVNLTHSQLFFLGFSQVWCTSATPEAERMTTLNDNHSPAKYRVIGPLANSVEFSAEFGCPAGSPMNPQNKCEVW